MWLSFPALLASVVGFRTIAATIAFFAMRSTGSAALLLTLLVIDLVSLAAFISVARQRSGLYLKGEFVDRYLNDVWRFNCLGSGTLAHHLDGQSIEEAKTAYANAITRKEGAAMAQPLAWLLLLFVFVLTDGILLMHLNPPRIIATASSFAVLSMTLACLISPIAEYFGNRHLLQHGYVRRQAVLTRRSWEDYGISSRLISAHFMSPILLLIPVFLVDDLLSRVLLLTALALCLGCLGLARLVMETSPYLRFDGPVRVSAWVDSVARTNYLSFLLYAPPLLLCFLPATVEFNELAEGCIALVDSIILITTIIIVWRMNRTGRDSQAMSDRLQQIERNWLGQA